MKRKTFTELHYFRSFATLDKNCSTLFEVFVLIICLFLTGIVPSSTSQASSRAPPFGTPPPAPPRPFSQLPSQYAPSPPAPPAPPPPAAPAPLPPAGSPPSAPVASAPGLSPPAAPPFQAPPANPPSFSPSVSPGPAPPSAVPGSPSSQKGRGKIKITSFYKISPISVFVCGTSKRPYAYIAFFHIKKGV